MASPRLPLDVDDIVHRYESGQSISEIASALGVSDKPIRTRLRERGVNVRLRPLNAETAHDIIARYRAGESQSQIASSLDIHQTTVSNLLSRHDERITRSEAGRRKWASMTAEQRSDQVAAAHASTRGATLQRRHVKVNQSGSVTFTFKAKSGVSQRHTTNNPDVVRVVKNALEKTEGQKARTPLFNTSEKNVNELLASTTKTKNPKAPMSSKTLRTMKGTELALEKASSLKKPKTQAEFKKFQKEIFEYVSHNLGNTPTVAKNSYVDPVVFIPFQIKE